MKLLFDQGTPVPLRRHLTGHSVDTAADSGWSDVDNGELLVIVVLLSTAWPDVRLRIDEIRKAVIDTRPGDVRDVPI